jgi:hypothetical protein
MANKLISKKRLLDTPLGISEYREALEATNNAFEIIGLLHSMDGWYKWYKDYDEYEIAEVFNFIKIFMQYGDEREENRMFEGGRTIKINHDKVLPWQLIARKARQKLAEHLNTNYLSDLELTRQFDTLKQVLEFYSVKEHLPEKQPELRQVLDFLYSILSGVLEDRTGKFRGYVIKAMEQDLGSDEREEFHRLVITPLLMLGKAEVFSELRDVAVFDIIRDFALDCGKISELDRPPQSCSEVYEHGRFLISEPKFKAAKVAILLLSIQK